MVYLINVVCIHFNSFKNSTLTLKQEAKITGVVEIGPPGGGYEEKTEVTGQRV